MTLVNTDYSIAPLWRSGIVSDSLIIRLGFDSSPGHKISNCGSPLTNSIYIYIYIYVCINICMYIYIYIYIYVYNLYIYIFILRHAHSHS